MQKQASTLKTKILFACGQIGWCLAAYGVTDLVFQFYLPPDNGTPLFKAFIPQTTYFGIFKLVGIITFTAYFISAFMEPIVATLSDNSHFKWGKRKTFMLFSALPLAILSVLTFFPPTPYISQLNAAWMSVCILAVFLIICFYTTPYNALINELSHSESERMSITMIISVAYALGIGIGQTINLFIKHLGDTMGNERAFQTGILLFGILSAIFMYVPVLFVPDNSNTEKSYENKNTPFLQMISDVWSNKNFRYFAFIELLNWYPQKIFTIAVPYIVATLMKLDNVYTSYILYSLGLFSFALYPLIAKLTARYGKRNIMISACVFLMLSYLYTTFYGIFKLPTFWAVSIYVLLNIYPTAVLGLLPMAMAGDMAQADAQKTGIHKNASYYGMKTFMMKMGIALTSLIFPSLLLLGNTPDNSTGIRLVAFVSVITSVLSVILLMKYKDPVILMNDK